MISFYPGPSKIYPALDAYVKEAVKSGILSVNHRSKEFMQLSELTIKMLRRKLKIPADYTVLYTSSATECWEIIAQSLIVKKSLHLHNGAFGEKWLEYTKKICEGAESITYNPETTVPVAAYDPATEVICVVQNETSNGTEVRNKLLGDLKAKNPSALLAVDATSSMAGIRLDVSQGDIWFASVQKCFGLPAGMGLMICSPRAVQRALEINEHHHYNSLPFLIEKMKVWQTSYTPNVLSVFLLYKVLQDVAVISETEKVIRKRAQQWYSFLQPFEIIKPLIANEAVRSATVIAVTGTEKEIDKIKSKAKKEGLLLGNGYGAWAKNTFRIANFPAINEKEIRLLQKFLQQNVS